jgi:hypothetical protein
MATNPEDPEAQWKDPNDATKQAGRWALVEDISFQMLVYCRKSPALFAVFSIGGQDLIPGIRFIPCVYGKRIGSCRRFGFRIRLPLVN